MKENRFKPDGKIDYIDIVADTGVIDYVNSSGNLVEDVPAKPVMVRSSSDLSGLTKAPAGTIAFTAGFVYMWQKDASGNWQNM